MSRIELDQLQSHPYMDRANAELIMANIEKERAAQRLAEHIAKSAAGIEKGKIKAERRNKEAEKFRSESVVDRKLPLDGLNNSIVISVKERPKNQINIAGQGQTAADVFDAIGGKYFSTYTTLEFNGIRHDQSQMIELLKAGTSDVGITLGEIPVDLLKIGLTAFSPLKIEQNGRVVKPEHPVTVIARIPKTVRR